MKIQIQIQTILIKVCAHMSEYEASIFIPSSFWSSAPYLHVCISISAHEEY